MAASDKKISEGLQHLQNAEKALKTTLFKWKPDYDEAICEYGKAAIAFKNGKSLEKSRDAYLKAAKCQETTDSFFHAAKSMEAASLVCRDMNDFESSCQHVEEAAQLYCENGTPDTARMALERTAKYVEKTLPERAINLYLKAADIGEMEDNNHAFAEMTGKAARLYLRLRNMEKAIECLKIEMEIYSKMDHNGLLYKLVYVLVICYIQIGDYVMAERAFLDSTRYQGFALSDEAPLIEALIQAFEEGDSERAKALLCDPCFKFMDNEIVKLARDIDLPSGGTMKEDEEDEDVDIC